MSENLKLWKSVEKTNPKYTKKATISGGNKITAISPQFQIMNATEVFGSYGGKWGFKNINIDYSLTNIPNTFTVVDYKTKKEETVDSVLGLVGFKATFFYPNGEFEIVNSIKIFTDKKHNIIDDNYAKKLETDALTKALSKLGFNADIFLGKFDDVRYFNEVKKEFEEKPKPVEKPKLTDRQLDLIKVSKDVSALKTALSKYLLSDSEKTIINNRIKELTDGSK